MEVRVRMTPIYVSFAPGAGVELATLKRLPFEIDRSLELQGARARMNEDIWLGEVSLGESTAVLRRRRVGQQPDGVDANPEEVWLLRRVLVFLCLQRRGDGNQKQHDKTGFHWPGLYTGCGPSFALPNAVAALPLPDVRCVYCRKKKKLNTTAQML